MAWCLPSKHLYIYEGNKSNLGKNQTDVQDSLYTNAESKQSLHIIHSYDVRKMVMKVLEESPMKELLEGGGGFGQCCHGL